MSGRMEMDDSNQLSVPPGLAGTRGARDAKRTLMAGYTSVRELGDYGGNIRQGINEGYLMGPNISSAFAPLGVTDGHGDWHATPLPYVLQASAEGIPIAICDEVDECIKAVRQQLRKGARVIKVFATGGVRSLRDDPQDREFSDDELKTIDVEAARARRSVIAHCHGKDGMIAALNAGVKTIEHGSYMTEEVIDLMKEKDAILAAVMTEVEAELKNEDSWDLDAWKKLVALVEMHKKVTNLQLRKE